MYTKFCTDFSKEMLLNAAKCQDYSFYELLRENQLEEGVKFLPKSTQFRVKAGFQACKPKQYLLDWKHLTSSIEILQVSGLPMNFPMGWYRVTTISAPKQH